MSDSNPSRPKIGIVCVSYHPHYLAATLEALDRVRHQIQAETQVFVANQESAEAALRTRLQPSSACQVVRHDNRGLEFGAYQAGLDRMLATSDPDWVVFANDTFATHNSFGSIYRKKLRRDLSRRVEFPAVVGQVVSLPQSFRIGGSQTHRWITTHLFALNRSALIALENTVYLPEVDDLITESEDMAAFFSPQLDWVLREHLEAWLFRARAGWHWYGSDPLTSANAKKMAAKGRSVLQEKNLSARLERRSAHFFDLNELNVTDKAVRNLERKLFDFKRR